MSLHIPRMAVADAVQQAGALAARGRRVDAIDLLAGVHRAEPDPEVERLLVDLRLAAWPEVRDGSRPAPPPEPAPPTTDLRDGLPVVGRAALTPGAVRAAVAEHGCVRVPDLLDPDRCGQLRDDIDRAFAAAEACFAGVPDPVWYRPFTPVTEPPGPALARRRRNAAEAGALWTADSPRLLQSVCELVEDTGLRTVIEGYLGQRPTMSATKVTLRRVPLDTFGADWHQDGAFLGTDCRILNVWITLTDCGVDAPTLDLVPRRVDHVVETGTEGANFSWSVSPRKALEAAGDAGTVRPVFRAGEALLFDELLLHRTACVEGMTRHRYALENWFFAAAGYPAGQVPLVL